jgi:uncharacterized protein DUF6916
MDLSREMVLSDFSGRIGKIFNVHVAGQIVPLRLEALQELPGSKRPGGSFRLEFIGPLNPQLGQGVFPFLIGTDQYGIFIVPLGRSPLGARYEAIFY